MNKLHLLIVFSVLGVCGSMSPMEKVLKKPKEAIRVLLAEEREGSLTEDQLAQLKELCSEDIKENLNVQNGTISLPSLAQEDFEIFINNLDAIAESPGSLRLFSDDFDDSSDIKGYKALVRAADYLGIEEVVKVAFAWLKKNVLSLVRSNPPVALELLSLPFTAYIFDFDTDEPAAVEVLCYASEKGFLDIVTYLLLYGVGINGFDEFTSNGYTALMYAVEKNQKQVAEFLIEQDAEVNHAVNDKTTALVLAAENGIAWAIELLLDHGAQLDKDFFGSKLERNAFFVAVKSGHEAIVALFLEKILKLGRGFSSCVHELGQLDREAWIHMQDDAQLFNSLLECINRKVPKHFGDPMSPLMAAVTGQHVGIVKLLLSSGAFVNKTDDRGNTALMLACERGNLEIAGLLLGCDADVDLKKTNTDKKTALMIAQEKGHADIVALLEKHVLG